VVSDEEFQLKDVAWVRGCCKKLRFKWGRLLIAEFSRGARIMTKSYIAISAIIFAVVAIGHLVRIVQGWQVQLGDLGVAMSVSWAALVVSVVLAVWGAVLLRRWLNPWVDCRSGVGGARVKDDGGSGGSK
jgi:hypothetical protein